MRMRLVSGFLLAACAAAVSGSAHADCARDTDCKGDRVCINGACVDPIPEGRTPGQPAATTPVQPPPPSAPEAPLQGQESSALPAPGPEPGTVPVLVRGGDGLTVRSMTAGGQVQQCKSPCTLHLSPGKALIDVVGQFSEHVVVPDRPATLDITFRRRGMLIAGGVFTGIGLLSLVVGAKLHVDYNGCKDHPEDFVTEKTLDDGTVVKETSCPPKGSFIAGYVIGAVMLAPGLGMLIPGIMSRTGVTMNSSAAARPWFKNVAVGFAPRNGGGYFSAVYAF